MSFSMTFMALGAIADDFNVTLSTVSWVVIVQSLVISALMMPMGRLGDIIGRKRIHLLGLIFFGSGALLTAVASTFSILIISRIITSIGNAMGQSVGTALVVSAFPKTERGKAIGSQTTAVAIGGASGPIFGGFVVQFLPWEAMFLILLIPVVICFFAALFFLKADNQSETQKSIKNPFDGVGAFISAVAIVLLVVVINNPFGFNWISIEMLIASATFLLLMTIFVIWELRIKVPMLQLRMFASRNFTLAVLTRLFGFGGATAVRFIVPIFLISLLQLNEAAAGAILLLTSVGMAIGAQISGRMSDRIGPRPFAISGFFLALITTFAMIFVGRDTSLVLLGFILLFNGLSMGLWNVTNNTVIIGSASDSELGVIGAFTNLTRNLGNVTGQALSASVVAGVMLSSGFDVPLNEIGNDLAAGDSFLSGTRVAYLLVSGITLISLVLTIFTKSSAGGINTKDRSLPVENTVLPIGEKQVPINQQRSVRIVAEQPLSATSRIYKNDQVTDTKYVSEIHSSPRPFARLLMIVVSLIIGALALIKLFQTEDEPVD
jgi:MFS family permease|tara:strand:- start:977 stop:2623 length:1647 start_codon:yes stop_codon:yes gene_type:complete